MGIVGLLTKILTEFIIRPNKGRKYNGNTFKNRNNRTKRLALLGKCFSRCDSMSCHLIRPR